MADNDTTSSPPNPSGGSFFTSKPFIILVVAGIVLCGGMMLLKSLSANTALSFTFTLDGKSLPAGQIPEVKVDGQSFASGGKIHFGRHTLAVQLQNAEPFEKHFWILFGANNLGTLPLETSKGSLSVAVTPSPASVIVQRDGETVSQGEATLKVDKLPVGNYSLVIHRGRYEEMHSVTILRQQETVTNIQLNLGIVQLSSSPADAEFDLSGNNRHWQGELPTNIVDVPIGDYSLSVTRKGWELDSSIPVVRGGITTNQTEFPYGSIEVTSQPTGLVVSTNGVDIGKTPITLKQLQPATYNVTISDGENDITTNVSIGPKEDAKHDFVFRYGSVQLMSAPAGATVIRKGKEIGKTPLTLDHIPVGDSGISLTLDGYLSTNVVVSAVENVVTDVSVKLISEQYLQAMDQARVALKAAQFDQARKALAAALTIETNDLTALELQDEVSIAAAKAEEAKKEAEHEEIIGIIERAIKATGGREVISRFRFFKEVSSSSGEKNGTPFTMQTAIYVELPSRIRMEQQVANQPTKLGPLTLTVNGGKPSVSVFCLTENDSWEIIPSILGPVQQPISQNLQNSFRGTLYSIQCCMLVPLLRSDYTLEKLPSAPDGTVAIRVHKAGEKNITLLFNLNSGLLAGVDSEGNDEHGNTFQQSERYEDYRNFYGLICPTITRYSREGNTSSESRLGSIEPLDSGYASRVFARPTNQ